jgi:DNA modification methylase
MQALTFEDWPLDRLVEYENNPRKNDHAVDQMCAAITEMGFKVPIIAKSCGQVIDGHLRLKAARQLKLDTVPVILADDLSETQIKAFRIMINQSAHWADWDPDLLKSEMLELESLDFDLDLIGFTSAELDELLSLDDNDGQADEDAIPEPEDQVVSQRGDMWVLGNHRVMCGDSTSSEDVTILMAGELADMAFVDPPYNVDYGNNAKDKLRGKDRRILNDNLGNDFYQFLSTALTNLLSVTKGACYVAMSSSELDTLQKAFRDAGGKWSTFIIWAKNTFTLGRADYQRQFEPILYGWSEGGDHFWCGARDQGDVWFFNKPHKNDLHPTMKPVELVERAIRNSSKSRDIVLDLFGGSGSTLIACEKTGRSARMMELDPKYVDVIIRRWQDYSGNAAVLQINGEDFSAVNTNRCGDKSLNDSEFTKRASGS